MNSRNYFRFSKCGLGLIFNDETPKVINPNVIESTSLVLLNDIKLIMIPTPTSPSPLPLSPSPLSKKKDPGGIGFIEDIGGGVDGLMSSKENFGFESCEERRIDVDDDDDDERERDRWRKKRSVKKRLERNNNKKKFPPPLSLLNENGQPCFYLKPVRKNGRLELTEVKIQTPEILHAVRENGRLRLHLLSNIHNRDISSKINEEEEKVEESWKYRVTEDGLRRCQEVVMSHHQDHHHHHHHHGWRQPCVTTR